MLSCVNVTGIKNTPLSTSIERVERSVNSSSRVTRFDGFAKREGTKKKRESKKNVIKAPPLLGKRIGPFGRRARWQSPLIRILLVTLSQWKKGRGKKALCFS